MKGKDKDKKPRITKEQLKHEESIAHVPIENMFFKDLPPTFVSVVGPPSSGKSTLVRSMVKYFTQKLVDKIVGPVTVSCAKMRRITMFEPKTDIHQFIDVSKISDAVVFVIDASVGLEMETFEFLTLLISHGLSKIMCVVTHVDRKTNPKHLKSMKKRIWAEICPGIKFFNVGSVDSRIYSDNDVTSLCRMLGVMKCRPIEWKCTHPHVIVDRIDDEFVYGYVRGGMIQSRTDVYVPGLGDNMMEEVEVLTDPVPVYGEKRLSLRSRILYSPMSGIGTSDEVMPRIEGLHRESDDEDIQLFNGGEVLADDVNDVNEQMKEENIDCVKEYDAQESEESEQSDEMGFEGLLKAISGRFQKDAVTEEDLIEKFNEKYEEKEKDQGNFLLKEKRRLESEYHKNEEMMVPGMVFPGKYVKIRLMQHVPKDVDKGKAIILGSVLVSEKEKSMIQGKIKRYKWYKKILKSNEPVIFSVGWRRFQSIPVFSMKDATRNRMIKYTPESMHCNVSFYGHVVPAGTGFSVYSEKGNFKVLASGTVTDVNGKVELVKKLKLIGYPKRIIQNTVFVVGMFTSDLEVLKFQGASLKAVSGLRGQLKGPHGKDGEYRATFEGAMLMSDIIALRCFVPVDIHKILIPVENLMGSWNGLRRLHEIRQSLGMKYDDEESFEENESESCVDTDDGISLPSDIENELPLNKRKIAVVSKRIMLPIAPDSKNEYEMRERIIKERIKKSKEDEKSKAVREMKKREEREKMEKEKETRIKKVIQENYKESQRKFRKQR
ncbi:Glycoside hydrolase 2 Mannanase beta-galactosidase [Ordospora colligata]|uniref:Ribosome biogenesis GTP-binding protein n=1 Tax=Ordospora colligata OC4 TaxID=1354746 RepID=A0A0B2UEN3_9MICR|nr:ribosome biogenesis GTP-binding protein [Ordospora colligata OC4]KHN69546.1 ribosome biogenesis GTP-binding protein [Ordospora colligata OC4]TBU15366.1 ribosome biogenesis GTP-binding protein [Ordospora colligata]TBU15466.1 ribosome biogenesis GTP-binding protein [Ordospora colligata]